MGPKDAITQTLNMSDFILQKYLSDLSDADLRVVPVEGMNSIALQLGHLIVAENMFVNMINPGSAPELPAGFKEAHDIKNKDVTDAGFVGKGTYLELMAAQRAATQGILNEISDAELDDTRDGKLPSFARRLRALLVMTGAHAPWPLRPVCGGPPRTQEARGFLVGFGTDDCQSLVVDQVFEPWHPGIQASAAHAADMCGRHPRVIGFDDPVPRG